MTKLVIRFLNTVMMALVAGTVFGIWIGYNPKDLSAPTFVEQQQSAINALNTLMPLLGLITMILTLITTYYYRKEKKVVIIMFVAVVFLVLSGLITRFGNQPINSIVMTWDMNAPPGNWVDLRNQWWTYHIARTATTFIGLCLIVWVNMRKD